MGYATSTMAHGAWAARGMALRSAWAAEVQHANPPKIEEEKQGQNQAQAKDTEWRPATPGLVLELARGGVERKDPV